jgi:integrase
MSAFRRGSGWVSKFQLRGRQRWTPGGPWETKRQAQEAERRYRDCLEAHRTEETCASFAEQWLKEWPRPETSTHNPFSNLRLPVTEKRGTITAPTMDEYRALLDACTTLGGYGSEFKAMIQFAAWTGIRQGELFGLQWSDIDSDEVTISRSRKGDGALGKPKNGQTRTIPLLPPAQVLETVPRRPDSFIFHSPHGQPLRKQTHAHSWNKVRYAARVDVRWHDLRHFCATQLLELGLDHFAVSIQLGHTDGGALVMERYGHPSVDAAKRRLLGVFQMTPDETGSSGGSSAAEFGSSGQI